VFLLYRDWVPKSYRLENPVPLRLFRLTSSLWVYSILYDNNRNQNFPEILDLLPMIGKRSPFASPADMQFSLGKKNCRELTFGSLAVCFRADP
jgi:hypothetical protein